MCQQVSEGIENIEKRREEASDQGAAKPHGTSISNTPSNASGTFVFEGDQKHQKEPSNASDSVLEGKKQQGPLVPPARDHPKWPEFERYCRGRLDKHGNPGKSHEKGFETWLSKQPEKWSNTPAPDPDGELGWELDGKWYADEQATQLGHKDPNLNVKFRPALWRDGTFVLISLAEAMKRREKKRKETSRRMRS
jgi:hypothetical protein